MKVHAMQAIYRHHHRHKCGDRSRLDRPQQASDKRLRDRSMSRSGTAPMTKIDGKSAWRWGREGGAAMTRA